MRRGLGLIVMCAAVAAGCSGKSGGPNSPTAPSATTASVPSGPTTQSTATIGGSVRAASGGTVAIVGTALNAPIDGSGRFMVSGVPAGDVQLQVKAAAGSGSVPLAAVQPSQTVEVVVAVSGGSATVESEVRHGAGEAELKGTVDALPPTTPAGTFTSAGKAVKTDSSTVFTAGAATKTFADLKLGMHVEVHGALSGDTITATRVEIEDVVGAPAPNPQPEPEPEPHDPNPPAPAPPAPKPPVPNPTPVPAELNGTISGLTGAASSFQFMLGSTQVKGDSTTAITGDADATKTFADLKNGTIVEVNGTQQSGFVQAVRVHIEAAGTEPPKTGEDEAEVEGTLGAISGTCPSIASSVGTTKFTTNASTSFDDVACTALKAGSKVQVKGTRNADGSITATRLKKD